jgi:hypothetical protein
MCRHLTKWFGKSPKWKLFWTLPPHRGMLGFTSLRASTVTYLAISYLSVCDLYGFESSHQESSDVLMMLVWEHHALEPFLSQSFLSFFS